MSQQPDPSSTSNYWQFEQSDIEADAGSQPVQPDQQRYAAASTATVAAQEQHDVQASAWQVPNLAAQGKHAQAATPVRAMPKVRRPSPVRMLLLLALVVLLGVAGSASGFGLSALTRHHGQATVPSPVATSGQPPLASPTATPRMSPSPTPTQRQPSPSPTNRPSPTVVPQPVILAQDTFARPDQQFWGRASDGSPWGGDANSSQVFAIVGGTGQLQDGQGFFNAILGPQVANEEVFYRGSVSHFDQLRDNVGAVLRWTDNEHYYKAYLDGASLILIKRVNGVVSRLGAVPFAAQDGRSYSLRFRAVGQQLFVRAWPSAGPEPGGWMITASDGSLASGFGGLRALLENDITVTVTLFQERSIA